MWRDAQEGADASNVSKGGLSHGVLAVVALHRVKHDDGLVDVEVEDQERRVLLPMISHHPQLHQCG